MKTVIMEITLNYMLSLGKKIEVQKYIDSGGVGKQTKKGVRYLVWY